MKAGDLMKYKVLLADDEEEVLHSIHRQIDWDSYGFEIAGTFLNGHDVMEFLETQEADIVITDIQMPFMGGIELAKNIREKYPQIKVIIISGYGDFHYAKEAMSCQVMDYILKPVNAKELCDVLEKTRRTLERELEEKKNIRILKRKYQENLPLLRENFLNRLIAGGMRKEWIAEEIKNCGMTVGDAAYWVVALIQMEKMAGVETRGGSIAEPYISVYVRSLVQERFQLYHYEIFYSQAGECILFGMKEPEQIERILFRLIGIARESRKIIGVRLTAGVGKIKDRLSDIKASFEEAREALMFHKMARDGEVIYMGDIDMSRQTLVLFDKESREMLFAAMKFGDSEAIRLALSQLHDRLKSQNMSRSVCQGWIVSVMNALLLLGQKYGAAMEEIFGGVPDCLKIMNQYEDLDSFFGWMENRCLLMGKYFEQERAKKGKNIIEIAKEYTQRQFRDPEMSRERAAMEIGMTAPYFSSLFKRETGEAFGDYLTRLRLEEAIRMLDETDAKIYEIAEQIGYLDAGYFSHVFKKKYGISPIQYRRQRMGRSQSSKKLLE